MKLTAGEGGEVVVVGVKFDDRSGELLTWALMKVAQSGDRVVALHVLDTAAAGGTASLLSLVKTFESLLAAYEGFCNLKQVDLKLKVCRGLSVKKILVREAKGSGASKLILGTSKTHHTISSPTSKAKYCARKLSRTCSVFAVNSGKLVLHREATEKSSQESRDSLRQPQTKTSSYCSLHLELPDNSGTQLSGKDGHDDDSLALVPVQMKQASPNLNLGSVETRHSWSFLRWVYLPRRRHPGKFQVKRASGMKWVLKLPGRDYSSVVHPDQRQCVPREDYSSDLEAENGAIEPVGPQAAWTPISPYNEFDGLPEEVKDLRQKYSSSCRYFSYEDLLLATANFTPENMVGRGGSSHVYKGCLPDGKELAVKILKPSEDAIKEFVVEIEIITTLNHKNIISLFGFCYEHSNLILVYDFLSRGSLEENLHGHKDDWNAFGWHERYKVAVGVAEALDHLHNGFDQPVIHRDVKSSNILLSDDFEPQLSDFGLATRISTSSSHITCTDVTGTFGYLAPEYFMHGKVSDKVDVFAFGVVLLELLSGRMPINSGNPNGQESLVMWAKPILEGSKISQLLDPNMGREYDDQEIERMVLAATLCIRRSPKSRPKISLVLKLLQGDEEVMDWARQQVISPEEVDALDGESFPSNIQSHLKLALLDLDDDSISISSTFQGISLEDYLQGRWSRTSSFD